jgi:fatty-acyl-CoA synthase
MVLPSSNLQPETIIKILIEEKSISKWGSNHLVSVYHALKRIRQKKISSEEYLVGGSAPKKSY